MVPSLLPLSLPLHLYHHRRRLFSHWRVCPLLPLALLLRLRLRLRLLLLLLLQRPRLQIGFSCLSLSTPRPRSRSSQYPILHTGHRPHRNHSRSHRLHPPHAYQRLSLLSLPLPLLLIHLLLFHARAIAASLALSSLPNLSTSTATQRRPPATTRHRRDRLGRKVKHRVTNSSRVLVRRPTQRRRQCRHAVRHGL